MAEKEKDQLLDSDYDGIQEYDNDLPRWWVNIFWVTIIFSVFYFLWIHVFRGYTQHEKLAADLQELQAARVAMAPAAGAAGITDESLLKLAASAEVVGKGKEIFAAKCLACHGPEGQGLIGPNLTDNYWIHGGKISNIHTTVVQGVPAKGMLAWGTMMTQDEINAVVAFVWSIKGTTPPNPKAPEGQLVE